jgi:hypothetical protein
MRGALSLLWYFYARILLLRTDNCSFPSCLRLERGVSVQYLSVSIVESSCLLGTRSQLLYLSVDNCTFVR